MKKRTQSSSKGVSYVSRKFVKVCLLWIFSLSSLMIQAQDNQRISVDLRGESLESTLWYLQNRLVGIFIKQIGVSIPILNLILYYPLWDGRIPSSHRKISITCLRRYVCSHVWNCKKGLMKVIRYGNSTVH